MELQKIDRAKEILDNFNRVDESVQDKLINGVKCLAFLYDLSETNDAEKAPLPAQPA